MIRLKSTDRITICGNTGTGKTTLVKYLARNYLRSGIPILIYDSIEQYHTFSDDQRYIPKSNSFSEFDAICYQVIRQGNMVFIVEECERYLGQGQFSGPSYAFDLINKGRNWGLGLIAVTRRIQRLSKDYFDLCQSIFFFKCGLTSRGYLNDMIGREKSDLIIGLKQYEFLHYDVDTSEFEITKLNLVGSSPQIEEAK